MSEKLIENHNRKKVFILCAVIVALLLLTTTWFYNPIQNTNNCESEKNYIELAENLNIDYNNKRYSFLISNQSELQIEIFSINKCKNYEEESKVLFLKLNDTTTDYQQMLLNKLYNFYKSNPGSLSSLTVSNKVAIQKDSNSLNTFYKTDGNNFEFRSVDGDMFNIGLFVNEDKMDIPTVYKHSLQKTREPKYIYFLTIDLFEDMERVIIDGDVNPGFYRLSLETGEVRNVNKNAETDYFSKIYANGKRVILSRSNFIDVYYETGAFIQSVNLQDMFDVEPPYGIIPTILYFDDSLIMFEAFNGFDSSSELVILSIDELLRSDN